MSLLQLLFYVLEQEILSLFFSIPHIMFLPMVIQSTIISLKQLNQFLCIHAPPNDIYNYILYVFTRAVKYYIIVDILISI